METRRYEPSEGSELTVTASVLYPTPDRLSVTVKRKRYVGPEGSAPAAITS